MWISFLIYKICCLQNGLDYKAMMLFPTFINEPFIHQANLANAKTVIFGFDENIDFLVDHNIIQLR